MDIDEFEEALNHLEWAIQAFEASGEISMKEKAVKLMGDALDLYEAGGGDRSMYDAAIA